MFKSLSSRLGDTLNKIRGQGRLTEDNIKKTVKEIRNALIEADVSLEAVQGFIKRVKRCALGREISSSLTPGQTFIKMVRRELTELMGESCSTLNLNAQPPVVILMAGLQGSGKTTTTIKLARRLQEKENKKVLVASCDIYRPAAMEQLKTLAEESDIQCCTINPDGKVLDIAKNALSQAKKELFDVLIIDTAGRLHVDNDMMDEVKALDKLLNPTETLFVVDSMSGQDAANTAKAFDDALSLTGVILTKADGDARGGAALSIRHVTGKPIKFLGMGEKTDALEAFHPDRLAGRILGMGDVVSLIEQVEQQVDEKKAKKLLKKVKKSGLDFEDLLDQFQQLEKMGGIGSMLEKMPGMDRINPQALGKFNQEGLKYQKALIQSMTVEERQNPEIIKSSRKKRIAQGAGRDVVELNRLIKQVKQMSKLTKRMGKGGNQQMAQMMQQMGKMP